MMRAFLKLEQFFILVLAVFLFSRLPYAWWLYPLLFLTPDIGMLGYAAGPAVGAATYNILHHQGLAVLFYLAGTLGGTVLLQLIGTVLLGHSGFDRVMGYGLKYPDAFKHTHLGWLGAPQTPAPPAGY